MNIFFLGAGIISLLGGLAHALGGEYFILRPFDTSALPYTLSDDSDLSKRYLRNFWHFFTIDLTLSAIALFMLTFTELIQPPGLIAGFIALHFVGYTLVIWLIAIGRPKLFVTTALQWGAFLLIALLAWGGTR